MTVWRERYPFQPTEPAEPAEPSFLARAKEWAKEWAWLACGFAFGILATRAFYIVAFHAIWRFVGAE